MFLSEHVHDIKQCSSIILCSVINKQLQMDQKVVKFFKSNLLSFLPSFGNEFYGGEERLLRWVHKFRPSTRLLNNIIKYKSFMAF